MSLHYVSLAGSVLSHTSHTHNADMHCLRLVSVLLHSHDSSPNLAAAILTGLHGNQIT